MKKFYAPVLLFTASDVTEIRVTDSLLIRPITNSEYLKYFGVEITFKNQRAQQFEIKGKYADIWSGIPKGDLSNMGDYKRSFPFFAIESTSCQDIEDLIFTLRILYSKTVVCPLAVYEDIAKNECKVTYFRPFNFTPNTFFNTSGILKIESFEVDEIKHLFQKVSSKKNTILRDRINICLDLQQNEFVRFIEAISVIESILCGNDSGELRFRFSLYSSYILKKVEPDVDFNAMKDLYSIRSKLVHTGNRNGYNKQKFANALKYMKLIYRENLNNKLGDNYVLNKIEELFVSVK